MLPQHAAHSSPACSTLTHITAQFKVELQRLCSLRVKCVLARVQMCVCVCVFVCVQVCVCMHMHWCMASLTFD